MRNRFIIVGLFMVAMIIFVFSSFSFSQESPTLYWYRVNVVEGQTVHTFQGTFEYNEKELIEKIKTEDFILLENIIFYDQLGKIMNLDVWDPTLQPRTYLNTKYITAITPLKGDPRKTISNQ
jgi:hypothetical protein